MIANILAIIFLLKLSSKTHLNAPKVKQVEMKEKEDTSRVIPGES